MRRFMLIRNEDTTGTSGVGHVADGVVFDDGTVAMRWRTETRSTALYDSIEAVTKIHGHDGKTVVSYHDDGGPTVWLCCRCLATMDPPLNHCFQCGGGGMRVAMDRDALNRIRQNDAHRREVIGKQAAELSALRRVAIDVIGATALGATVFRGAEGGAIGVRVGDAIYGMGVPGVEVEPGSDEERMWLDRAAESAAFDPEHVRAAWWQQQRRKG